MIDQTLIDLIKNQLDNDWQVETELVCSLLDNYTSLIEQNAELHKSLAKANKVNKAMHEQVGGYLHGEEFRHWQEFNKRKFLL